MILSITFLDMPSKTNFLRIMEWKYLRHVKYCLIMAFCKSFSSVEPMGCSRPTTTMSTSTYSWIICMKLRTPHTTTTSMSFISMSSPNTIVANNSLIFPFHQFDSSPFLLFPHPTCLWKTSTILQIHRWEHIFHFCIYYIAQMFINVQNMLTIIFWHIFSTSSSIVRLSFPWAQMYKSLN